ncbi:MAG: hypothetical protein EXS09_13315 [Gemmataceae bacterium]|nr:hypothetical protein [Gemmataceae bacterium]
MIQEFLSPDGRRLLTFNDRSQLHIWEIASGQLAFTLDYPNGHFADARFGVDGRTIITSNHREVIVWDLKPTTKIVDPWEALGHDAPVAEQARRTLLADPKHAVAYLEKRLRPAPDLDEPRISRSIAALEHKDFRERERATVELIEYGRGVLPRLQEARLASEEGKARLASLVLVLSAGPMANEMRRVRVAEILEQARLVSPLDRAFQKPRKERKTRKDTRRKAFLPRISRIYTDKKPGMLCLYPCKSVVKPLGCWPVALHVS